MMFDFTPYIECRFAGDVFNGNFSNGLTMTQGVTTNSLKMIENDRFTDGQGHFFTLHHTADEKTVRYAATVVNAGDTEAKLDLLSSFACKLGEFDRVWRLQSFWSAEGKIKVDTLVDLHLTHSWCGTGVRSEKFYNLGSMPVRKYFPFLALENTKTGEFLGINLSWGGSWQFELFCLGNAYYLSCGLADYDTGHFRKSLKPGEQFTTPQAIVASGSSFEEVCQNLLTAQHPDYSPADRGMSVLFNEFCTTWGNPSEENIDRIIDRIKGKGIEFLVIDCGWFQINDAWYNDQGEWDPNKQMFPNGLKPVADKIRAAGMIPGLWFELEVTGIGTSVFYKETDHLLQRDGVPITAGTKRFWDMTDPWVIDYLTEKVIRQLKDNGFGYLKIDYNDSIGVGCDGFDSLGEGLRRQIEGSAAFFRRIKQEIPDMVIELCASGGHRLTPYFLELVSQASFSDAHETVYIPIIAANLHRVMHPKQSQIWAVLRGEDSLTRLQYQLINTLLGRMCLSGDIYDLDDAQWQTVQEGIAFYKQASDIIQYGKTVYNVCTAPNMVDPHGEQLVMRSHNGKTLVIYHRFADSKPFDASVLGGKTVLASYGDASCDFSAQAWMLEE